MRVLPEGVELLTSTSPSAEWAQQSLLLHSASSGTVRSLCLPVQPGYGQGTTLARTRARDHTGQARALCSGVR